MCTLPLGDSSQAPVGMQVVAIGNPFGLNGTMTIGIISARGRTLESLRQSDSGGTFTAPDLIKPIAAINPGNSGGPLLNLAGEVIGVNRAIATGQNILGSSSGNIGIGYAISSNIVRRVVPSLIEYGTYDYPYLGIAALSDDYMTLETCDKLELPQCTGAYVSNVVNGGPGDRAGLHGARTDQNGNIGSGGDLIVAIDGEAVVIFNDLVTHITLNNYPGETVTLTVIRNGEQVDIPVTLGREAISKLQQKQKGLVDLASRFFYVLADENCLGAWFCLKAWHLKQNLRKQCLSIRNAMPQQVQAGQRGWPDTSQKRRLQPLKIALPEEQTPELTTGVKTVPLCAAINPTSLPNNQPSKFR